MPGWNPSIIFQNQGVENIKNFIKFNKITIGSNSYEYLMVIIKIRFQQLFE